MSEDGFVELAPPGQVPAVAAKVVLNTYELRGAERLSVNFDLSYFRAARVAVAWSAERFELRITADDERGGFAVQFPPGKKGPGPQKRGIVKLVLPAGLAVVKRKEPGVIRLEGKHLYVVVPPPMRSGYVDVAATRQQATAPVAKLSELAQGRAPSAPSSPPSRKEATLAAVRALAPAPTFK